MSTFSEAITAIKAGSKAKRSDNDWGKGLKHIFYVTNDSTELIMGVNKETPKRIVPLNSIPVEDILATDWVIILI